MHERERVTGLILESFHQGAVCSTEHKSCDCWRSSDRSAAQAASEMGVTMSNVIHKLLDLGITINTSTPNLRDHISEAIVSCQRLGAEL